MSGFNFGSSGGFSFNATPTATTTTTPGFSFLTPSVATTAVATTTVTTTTTSTNSGGIKFTGFATPPTTTSASAGASFNFNLNPAATSTATSSLNAGTSLFSSNTSSVSPSLGSGGLNLGQLASSTAAAAAPPPTTTGSTTGFPSFSFAPVPSSTNPIALSVTTTTTSSFGPVATLSTATTTSSFGAIGAGGATNLSMRQLEERLNKWLVELKEQEERFLRQAAHVNAWDQILQNGHDQVQSLKDTLHTVKSDQTRLEAEIDFIRGQQEELERLLEPLESATNANPAAQLHQGDRQRDNMYHLAQSLDAQLRQMTDDLGKVIEHLNTNSGSLQPNDPVNLVARILSAHMDTLKWVDQNTTLLSQKMEDVARVSANIGKRG